MNPQEAKSWLIAQITAEADPLEAGMLHYSESERTPANYEALLEAFDSTHDERAFESRIAAIIRNLQGIWRDESSPKLAQWRQALELLRGQDHYLLVLARAAGDNPLKSTKKRPTKSWTLIFLISVVATALLMWLVGHLNR